MKEPVKHIVIYTVAALATIFCLSHILLSPGSIILNLDGDGAKNYYTFLFHVQYGQGIWFNGMNYPYGEHIVFTDAQPIFAILLSWIHRYIPFNPLAVFHLLLAISFFLCIIYLFRILRRFGLNNIWSISGAILITVMSPQGLKLGEHFSLAYFCVLPCLFYYNLSWLQTGKRKYIFYLCIAAFVFTFLHLYYALMFCFWALAYSIGYFFLTSKKIKEIIRHVIPVLTAVIIPVVCFLLFIAATDPVTDRPSYPYGARWNRTFIEDLYTSCLSPFSKIVQPLLSIDKLSCGGEGYTYIGIIPIIILLSATALFIYKIALTRKINIKPETITTAVAPWIFIAIPMLIFATSIVFTKCFVCLDYAYFIKQFRAVGRFSWIYYYIITVAAVVILYRWQLLWPAWIRNSVTILALCIWAFEAYPFAQKIRSSTKQGKRNYSIFFDTNESKSWKSILSENGYTPSDFQCVLSLPYFHIGTEKLGLLPFNYNNMWAAFGSSYTLNLPLMDVMMSRGSWQQAFAQLRIQGGPMTEKVSLKNNKPILVLYDTAYHLNPDCKHLLSFSKQLGVHQGMSINALMISDLLAFEEASKKRFRDVAVIQIQKDTVLDNSMYWYEHFDTGKYATPLFGSGAAMPIEGIVSTIHSNDVPAHSAGLLHEFSAWILVSNKDYKIPRFRLYFFNKADSLIKDITILAQEPTDSKGLWLRAGKYFTMPDSCVRMGTEMVNIINPAYLALDELLIRPATSNVISKDKNGGIMVNNHNLK